MTDALRDVATLLCRAQHRKYKKPCADCLVRTLTQFGRRAELNRQRRERRARKLFQEVA